MTTSQMQQLIAEARLPEALVALKETLPPHLQNDIVHLQSRLSELQRKQRMGIVDGQDANLERNQITAAALDLCNQIDTSVPTADTKEGKIIIQNAEKIYNIDRIDNANFS